MQISTHEYYPCGILPLFAFEIYSNFGTNRKECEIGKERERESDRQRDEREKNNNFNVIISIINTTGNLLTKKIYQLNANKLCILYAAFFLYLSSSVEILNFSSSFIFQLLANVYWQCELLYCIFIWMSVYICVLFLFSVCILSWCW